MALFRRGPRPLPPSVPVHAPVPWVDPADTAPPPWRRLLSGVELGLLTFVLGIVVAVCVGILLVGAFFLVDFLIS
jgi:hypothetical protein